MNIHIFRYYAIHFLYFSFWLVVLLYFSLWSVVVTVVCPFNNHGDFSLCFFPHLC